MTTATEATTDTTTETTEHKVRKLCEDWINYATKCQKQERRCREKGNEWERDFRGRGVAMGFAVMELAEAFGLDDMYQRAVDLGAGG